MLLLMPIWRPPNNHITAAQAHTVTATLLQMEALSSQTTNAIQEWVKG